MFIVRGQLETDFLSRDFLKGHFLASISLIVAFHPLDDRHEIVQSLPVVHHRLVLRVVTVTKFVFDCVVNLSVDDASGF